MSHRLFQCLSPAKDEAEAAEPTAQPVQTDSLPGQQQQRRSRSVMSAFLSLFRAESPNSSASATAQASAASAGHERRRRHHSAGSGRPANSRMKLKRDRCPRCHGVLPMKTPELPPVLVRPGQGRRRREFKEDSGCIMAQPRNGASDARPSGASAHASRPEDSGNYSMSSSVNQSELLASLSRPPMFGLHGNKFSTVVPRIPNRDAPMSNCLDIRG